jgi:hypothetical protein
LNNQPDRPEVRNWAKNLLPIYRKNAQKWKLRHQLIILLREDDDMNELMF